MEEWKDAKVVIWEILHQDAVGRFLGFSSPSVWVHWLLALDLFRRIN